jgi:hypothetical protein
MYLRLISAHVPVLRLRALPFGRAFLFDSMWSISRPQPLVVSPSRMFSTGRNCKCLCGWLAPLCSPELKKANKRFCLLPVPSCHAFKQAYVASRSSCSNTCVCCLLDLVARMKCSAIMGNLLSTSRWLGLADGMSTTWSAGGGFSKGSIFCLGVTPSCFGVGFLASEGQNRSWNCRVCQNHHHGRCMTGKATGTPVDVWITASSVGENSKLEVAFAELNLASTRLGSVSDKPKVILVK